MTQLLRAEQRAIGLLLKNTLYRNSVLLMLNTVALSVLGAIFWVIAAHLYSPAVIGVTTSIVSASLLITAISLLGFDATLIRFLPNSKRASTLIGSSLALTTGVSIVLAAIALPLIRAYVPVLNVLTTNVWWAASFIFFVGMNTINILTNSVFVAGRIAHYMVYVSLVFGTSRLLVLATLSNLGLRGPVAAFISSTAIAAALSAYYLSRADAWTLRTKVSMNSIRELRSYAAASYVSSLVGGLPLLLLPLIVASVGGTRNAAYYYITAMLIATLNVIPQATAQAFFAEGAHDIEHVAIHLRGAAHIAVAFMIPAVVVLIVGGPWILGVFGSSYRSHAYPTLVLMALAGVPKVGSYLLSTTLRIHRHVRTVAVISSGSAVVTIGGSILGLRAHMGIVSIGVATITSETLVVASYSVVSSMYNRPKGLHAKQRGS